MNGESDTIEGHPWILTHAPFGGTVAFRVGRWKLIPDIEEFYDIKTDPAEQNNLWEDPSAQAKIAEMQVWLGHVLKKIKDREARQNNGAINVC
jgi:arylsulfatase A-like enzyme